MEKNGCRPKQVFRKLIKVLEFEENQSNLERDKKQDVVGSWNNKNLNKWCRNQGRVEFIYRCFVENLNHARHVEIERLTFNSFYFALAVGVMAFVPKKGEDRGTWLIMCIGVFFAGYISITLTKRWNNAYDRHYTYAKRCYKQLHNLYLSTKKEEGVKEEDDSLDKEFFEELSNYPLYCFDIRSPKYGFF